MFASLLNSTQDVFATLLYNYFVIRVADRSAGKDYNYGPGKAECSSERFQALVINIEQSVMITYSEIMFYPH
jgi:divalent metal cation (Fe/Co/Zn/Cd) transporter